MYFLTVVVHPQHPSYPKHKYASFVEKSIEVIFNERFSDGSFEMVFARESDESDYDRGLIQIDHVVKRGSYMVTMNDGRDFTRIKLFIGPQGMKKIQNARPNSMYNAANIQNSITPARMNDIDRHYERMMRGQIGQFESFKWPGIAQLEIYEEKKQIKIMLLM